MAGMDWFRWHHGSVTDPKFQLIARKSGASLPDVLAVWAYLLEAASVSDDRGNFGHIDTEALDCLFGFPSTETRTADIIAAMESRNLLSEFRVVKWEARQPKREREGDNSTERSRASRARNSQQAPNKTTLYNATPCNAMQRQETPRVEESRVEDTEYQPAIAGLSSPPSATSDQEQAEDDQNQKNKLPPCPHLDVLQLWAEVLPAMPQHNPEYWKGSRADHLRARWRETAASKKWPDQEAGLKYFRKLFHYVGTSLFLTGKVPSKEPGKRPFIIELEWLVNATNWARTHEGKYHTEA